MWCKIRKNKEDILVATVYLATGNTIETGNWNQEILDCLQKDIQDFKQLDQAMILGGDFNAHIIEFGGIEDRNGTLMKRFCEKNNLTIGNLSPM